MLISHRKAFIYTKTLKTAGTSIEAYFEPFCMPEGVWVFSHAREEYVSSAGIIGFRGAEIPAHAKWWNHMSAEVIREQIGEVIWNSYHRFCAIRNPFDKVVSAFFFFARRNSAESGARADASLASIKTDFATWVKNKRFPVDRDKYVIDGVVCMDDVIRYERLGEDLARLCARLGIEFEPDKVPSLKAGFRPEHIAIRELYTPQTKDIVARAYAFELDAFGYEFPD